MQCLLNMNIYIVLINTSFWHESSSSRRDFRFVVTLACGQQNRMCSLANLMFSRRYWTRGDPDCMCWTLVVTFFSFALFCCLLRCLAELCFVLFCFALVCFTWLCFASLCFPLLCAYYYFYHYYSTCVFTHTYILSCIHTFCISIYIVIYIYIYRCYTCVDMRWLISRNQPGNLHDVNLVHMLHKLKPMSNLRDNEEYIMCDTKECNVYLNINI